MAKGKFKDKALLIVGIVAICILGLVSIVLQGMTLVSWYSIWVPALIVAAGWGIGRALRYHREGRYDGFQACIFAIIGTLAVSTALVAAVLGTNYLGRNKAEVRQVEATVVNKYSETRTQRERRGRHYTGRQHTYQVYYIILELPDGRHKELQVTLEKYNRTKLSQQINTNLTPGFLGMDIFEIAGHGTES